MDPQMSITFYGYQETPEIIVSSEKVALEVARWLGKYFYEVKREMVWNMNGDDRVILHDCKEFPMDLDRYKRLLNLINRADMVVVLPNEYMQAEPKDLPRDATTGIPYYYHFRKGRINSFPNQSARDYVQKNPHWKKLENTEVPFISEFAKSQLEEHIKNLTMEDLQKKYDRARVRANERQRLIEEQKKNCCTLL